jgi:hypothetical protein
MATAQRIALFGVLFTVFTSTAEAQTWTIICSAPGQTLTSPDGNVQLTCGNSPNIVTVPHNGTLEPATMPIRTAEACEDDPGGFVLGGDSATAAISGYILTAYTAESGKYAWRVLNRLNRNRLDPQRGRLCATGGDPEASLAFDYYKQAITYAVNHVVGRGFIWDIHGHGHDERIELGYRLPRTLLMNPEAHESGTTISAFAASRPPSQTFTELLRDLGTRLRVAGYVAVPSDSLWEPEPNDDYFSASVGNGTLDDFACSAPSDRICGVQLELNKAVRNRVSSRQAFAAAFVPIMREYLAQFGITW